MIQRQRFQRRHPGCSLIGACSMAMGLAIALTITSKFIALDKATSTAAVRALSAGRLLAGGGAGGSAAARGSSKCAGTKGDFCKLWGSREVIPWSPPPRGDKPCLWNCNQVGVCDAFAGWCRCPGGWRGDACDVRMNRPCSQFYRSHGFEPHDEPLDWHNYGAHSRCSGYCDKDIGACYCPSNTTHGMVPASLDAPAGTPPERRGRPMGIHCQPNRAPDGSESVVGDVDPNDLTGPEGWCNAEQPKHHCPCQIDGVHGPTCDEVKEQVCLNQCNGHGECRLGWCACEPGWFGQDCANRNATTEWSPGLEAQRPWLRNLVHTPAARDPEPGATRARPLIYVYDLPPLYNQLMLSYRLDPHSCVPRIFTGDNSTQVDTGEQYNTELGLHEMLLQSEHRTLDPEEADFFYIPTYASCWAFPVSGYNDFPWFHGGPGANRAQAATNMYMEVHSWLRSHHPYWDRRGGADHILLATHDEGSCYIPSVLRNVTLLTHWGYHGLNNVSFSAYGGDIFDHEHFHPVYQPEGHLHKLGLHRCYDPSKDLVLPTMWPPTKYRSAALLGGPARKRTILGFHKGRLLADLPRFSRGTRAKLAKLAKDGSWWEEHRIHFAEGSPTGDDVKGMSYSDLLASSTFCMVVMGDGFTARFEDAVVHGCIPVIIMDDVHVGFESIVDVAAFSLRIAVKDVRRLPQLLKAVSAKEVEAKQRAIAKVWRRYFYSGYRAYTPVVLEMMQARTAAAAKEEAGDQLAASLPHPESAYDPTEDDAFATILQWLNSRIPHTRGIPK